MENQETPAVATPRTMIHLQVAGEVSQDDMARILTEFQETLKNGGVIATPANVVANVITATTDLSGLILTPKMTALEIATVVVATLGALESDSTVFADLDEDAKVEILTRIQQVLRFGGLLESTDEQLRDALFVAIVRALGSKLATPSTKDLITVTRISQKEGDEDFEVSFGELQQGDIFKHGDALFIAESAPYINWIANPLPIITIDAKLYQSPEAVTSTDASEAEEKKVQSKPSKSTAKARKK